MTVLGKSGTDHEGSMPALIPDLVLQFWGWELVMPHFPKETEAQREGLAATTQRGQGSWIQSPL